MEYKIEKWQLRQLLKILEEKKLDLNPPYQRNAIWPKKTQRFLINSIKSGIPVPSIFLYEKEVENYEMVDGQQRTRAIHLYNSTGEIDLSSDDSDFKKDHFLSYEIPVTIITKVEIGESIEEFYYMVNSSGVKLNRPETLKAQYFDSKFLKLVQDITISESFNKLNIIPANSQKRMLDRDLVEELCALVIYGITDKKAQVDKLYINDINDEDEAICRSKFKEILDHLSRFDEIRLIKTTRFRQRNDFYTLFGFIKDNVNIGNDALDYFYKLLIILEKGIRPNSRSAARELAEYAFNCVSQSNSANARLKRIEIFNNLFLNDSKLPNTSQEEIRSYYPAEGEYFKQIGKYYTFNDMTLNRAVLEKEQQNF
ncbi:hypothetical protein ADIARSV_2793 [Arcticibacter svalbardensis MN12-7]|uniref:GmrSD restriction endonucleases N-terminal domain-containing protein n=1 Tax=Arcticibacter svalbardensis MN12-7 TaxID=1150600 RepID=R9GY97_9SPHI|nr:DUF262 domain-containing protein [Arcticibacter svalbardensis]EOR93959.1 hypothetical protein ADIARSV_2793 [Arcticibacter svalbardensis MN12-7]